LLHKACWGALQKEEFKVCLQFSEAKWIGFPETPELTMQGAQGIQKWLDILLMVHARASTKREAIKSWLIFKNQIGERRK